MATTRDIILKTMNKYGNLISENLKLSVTEEIVQNLSKEGRIEDDQPDFVETKKEELAQKTAAVDKQRLGVEAELQKRSEQVKTRMDMVKENVTRQNAMALETGRQQSTMTQSDFLNHHGEDVAGAPTIPQTQLAGSDTENKDTDSPVVDTKKKIRKKTTRKREDKKPGGFSKFNKKDTTSDTPKSNKKESNWLEE